jgi:hypothetical protein
MARDGGAGEIEELYKGEETGFAKTIFLGGVGDLGNKLYVKKQEGIGGGSAVLVSPLQFPISSATYLVCISTNPAFLKSCSTCSPFQ